MVNLPGASYCFIYCCLQGIWSIKTAVSTVNGAALCAKYGQLNRYYMRSMNMDNGTTDSAVNMVRYTPEAIFKEEN